MIEARPTVDVRTAAFIRDVLVAVIGFTLGAPVGYWVLLALWALQNGQLPRRDELLPPSLWILCVAVLGAVLGIGVRASVGAIHHRRSWALAFFVASVIVTPVLFVALMAYVMSGRPY